MKVSGLLSASRLGLVCAAMVALTAITVKAAIIDDCEGGTNQNKFGAYWYYYDDAGDGGNSSILGTTRDPVTNKITAGCAPTAAQGNLATAGYQMNYTIGTTQALCKSGGVIIPKCGFNYVGIGTMLATEGNTCDITGATTITFWAKASPAVKLNVEVATTEVTDFNYYRTLILVGTAWAQYTISLDPGLGIAQQTGWGIKVDFNPKSVTKVQWQVHSDQLGLTAAGATGTVNIDDVEITPYVFTPPEVCKGCLTMTPPTAKALLSNFEGTTKNANAAGGWWYCYNDGEGRVLTSRTEYSDINAGIVPDATLLLGKSPKMAILGNGNPGDGAFIGFMLGKTFSTPPAIDIVKPFVGIGTSLTDALGTLFYNATGDGHTGVMFDYKITGTGIDFLRFEAISSNDLSAQGIVQSRLFPAGAGWQTAIVPFDSLKLPNWDKIKTMDPTATMLKKNQLKKLQWAIQDGQGKSGSIAIDNVYFIGGTKITDISSAVRYNNPVKTNGLAATDLVNRSLVVKLPSSLAQHIGTVSLVNIKGMKIAGKNINVTGGSTADLDVSTVANGMYFAVIKTKNLSGKEYSAIIPVNIY